MLQCPRICSYANEIHKKGLTREGSEFQISYMMQGLQNTRNTELKINVLNIQVFVGMRLTKEQ